MIGWNQEVRGGSAGKNLPECTSPQTNMTFTTQTPRPRDIPSEAAPSLKPSSQVTVFEVIKTRFAKQ